MQQIEVIKSEIEKEEAQFKLCSSGFYYDELILHFERDLRYEYDSGEASLIIEWELAGKHRVLKVGRGL